MYASSIMCVLIFLSFLFFQGFIFVWVNMYSDESDVDFNYEDALTEVIKKAPQNNCAVMHADVIRQKQEEDISSTSNVLSVSRVSAIILLLRYNWFVEKLKEEWFTDEDKVCKAVGLFEKPIINQKKNQKKKRKLACGICFEAYHPNKMHDVVGCGHLFCESCWKGYIGTSVNDGPGCLKLPCPEPSCNAAVGQDMINAFACEETKQKYSNYLLRSYIEDNREFKWCPAPDCGLAIKFEVGSDSCDVTCECTYTFCWNCTKEAHRPVDCGTMEKWILKNSDESENVTWILAHSKPCPNCKRPIEKGIGCNHMTCTMCGFEFCWICLVSYKRHSCNRFKGDRAADNLKRDSARNHLAKYSHYYERWVANHRSMDHAVKSMNGQVKELCLILCSDDEKEVKFIKDAWEKIIECRQLFEYLQGEAESRLERLHRFVEQELQVCMDSATPLENLKNIRKKLEIHTTTTGDHFEKLVNAFKDGLSEVDSQGAGSSNKEYEGRKYPGTRSMDYESSEYEEDFSDDSSEYEEDFSDDD
ncbi:hypothetical protein MKX03_034603 [Papaver bracteatum]|nr:hypothetical protein MKX03_034603 [Papaver bracteatum]